MIAAWQTDAEGAPTGAPLARDEAREAWERESARAWLALEALSMAAWAGDRHAAEALQDLETLTEAGTARGAEGARLRALLAALAPALDWLDAEAQGLTGPRGPQTGAQVLEALDWVDRSRAEEGGAEGAALLAEEIGGPLLAAWVDAGGRRALDRAGWHATSRTDAEIRERLRQALDQIALRERIEQRRDSGAEA